MLFGSEQPTPYNTDRLYVITEKDISDILGILNILDIIKQ